ncbi:MAG: hypothetical protein JWM41_245 [Gemmatimonadetes bacterium]|nr:hypothetical protein [Gemmatimonadota bacterium]
MTHTLPARPSLEHFRGQAKTLLAELRAGDARAAHTFIGHLPKARGLTVAKVRAAQLRLADAQSVVARRNGFPSWPALVRHVETLRALEGAWAFESLRIDGTDAPSAMLAHATLLFDGDRFRMESPEAHYDGRFTIDTALSPMQLDIEFVEGPEAGHSAYGLLVLNGDELTICLGVVGASRPAAFESKPGTGHALERLRRVSAARPPNVTGGVRQAPAEPPGGAPASAGEPGEFELTRSSSDMLRRLEGAWVPVRLVMNGEEMRQDWLPFGSRVGTGDESKVTFGGQVMLHVRMRIDDSARPVAVDYVHLSGRDTGKLSRGILEWVGDEVRFLIAPPGRARPSDFSAPGTEQTFSQWKRRE